MTDLRHHPRAVLDTNAVLDWLVFRDPGCAALAGALESGALHWLLTPAMKEECEQVLRRPAFAARRWHAFESMTRWARVSDAPCAPREPHALRCSDPNDQKFIDLAIETGARWLLTRDRALLVLARRAALLGIEVLAPAHWGDRRT